MQLLVLLSIAHAQLTHQCSSDPSLYLTACSWSYKTIHAGHFWVFQTFHFKGLSVLAFASCLLRPRMILFIVTAKNVWVLYFRKQYLVFCPCLSCFHSSTNTSSLLSLLPCKTEWFCSVFSDTITLLSNILLTLFIKQYCQSTLLPLQLRYVLLVIKGLKIWFECLPVFCITMYFSDVTLKKICVGWL